MLDSSVAQSALPPLELTLEIVAGVQGATLAAREGRIELVALGDASITARLTYRNVVVKEHATGISGERATRSSVSRLRPTGRLASTSKSNTGRPGQHHTDHPCGTQTASPNAALPRTSHALASGLSDQCDSKLKCQGD